MKIKPLIWTASALDDLRAFPDDARRQSGYQLRRVQMGLTPDDWKAMASVGQGVFEVRVHTALEHRVLYISKFDEAVYVLHAFEKRTMKTQQADIELAKDRLAAVQRSRSARKKDKP